MQRKGLSYRWRLLLVVALAFGLVLLSPAGAALAQETRTLTFDELPVQPANGLSFKGVTFRFEVSGVPSTDANYHSGGPGSITFVQDPSLEGNAAGTLTLEFDQPVTPLEFGVALSSGAPLTPGFSVELFSPQGNSLGVTPVNTSPLVSFTEAKFTHSGGPVSRAVITFNSSAASRFAFDNLTFTLGPSNVPVITLRPTFSRNLTGASHTVTATVQDASGNPQSGVAVDFKVKDGPNQGTTGTGTTNANGEASFTYTSSAPGIDSIVAEFTDNGGVKRTSNVAQKQWVAPSPIESCNGLDDNGDGRVDEGFPDSDGDGIADCVDQDKDNDGVGDGTDNCPQVANPDQADANGNGIGDACDPNTPPILNPPSPVEIETDGQFGPPSGEWTAITPASFLSGDSLVYSAVEGQDIYLMYDYRLNAAPLSAGQTVGPISFQVGSGSFFEVFVTQGGPNTEFGPNSGTSEGGSGDTVQVFLNGAPFDNSAGCVEGAVDHNSTSPNFTGAHNLVELKVGLRAFGGCYSSEPAFWSATLPSVQPRGPVSAPAAAVATDNVQVSAAFFKVASDGTTLVTPLALPNRPPDCSAVTASPNALWPPNHKLRSVSLSGATDPDGDTVSLEITDVTQDEPLTGSSDSTSPDARLVAAPDQVNLRAERDPEGNGRVYRVSFTGSDGKGLSCAGTVKVGVPKSMGNGATPIDSAPPSFNSLGDVHAVTKVGPNGAW